VKGGGDRVRISFRVLVMGSNDSEGVFSQVASLYPALQWTSYRSKTAYLYMEQCPVTHSLHIHIDFLPFDGTFCEKFKLVGEDNSVRG
jgi:hypothetical protein